MKSTNIFKVLLMISITKGDTYSMMRIPTSATNAVIAQISNMSKHIPHFATRATNQPQIIPQVKFNLRQMSGGMFRPTTLTNLMFKPTLTSLMFKPNFTKLISWSYKENPQSVLGITSSNITEAELKAAHKKMALKLHPDCGGKKEEFVKAQEAYEYLMHQLKTGQLHSKPNNASQQAHSGSYSTKNSNHSTHDFKSSHTNQSDFTTRSSYTSHEESFRKACKDALNRAYKFSPPSDVGPWKKDSINRLQTDTAQASHENSVTYIERMHNEFEKAFHSNNIKRMDELSETGKIYQRIIDELLINTPETKLPSHLKSLSMIGRLRETQNDSFFNKALALAIENHDNQWIGSLVCHEYNPQRILQAFKNAVKYNHEDLAIYLKKLHPEILKFE